MGLCSGAAAANEIDRRIVEGYRLLTSSTAYAS